MDDDIRFVRGLYAGVSIRDIADVFSPFGVTTARLPMRPSRRNSR